MIYRSAHLIANNVVVDGALPFEIGAGVVLRRPDEQELPRIRELLAPVARPFIPYECQFTSMENGKIQIERIEDLNQWHYYVLSDDQGGSKVHELESALLFLEPSIELSVRVISRITGEHATPENFGHAPPQPYILERYHYYALHNTERVVIRTVDFEVAEQLRVKLASLPDRYAFIRLASDMMTEIRLIPWRSRLQVIGYFSIIESLVAHKPRLPESLDSISHQIQGKLQLLCNEAGFASIVDGHFSSDKTIWKCLYAYRSALAHGNAVNFNGQFSILKSQENVARFLASLTRRIMLFALDRPQLLSDIKQC